jgi:hypothetical protein
MKRALLFALFLSVNIQAHTWTGIVFISQGSPFFHSWEIDTLNDSVQWKITEFLHFTTTPEKDTVVYLGKCKMPNHSYWPGPIAIIYPEIIDTLMFNSSGGRYQYPKLKHLGDSAIYFTVVIGTVVIDGPKYTFGAGAVFLEYPFTFFHDKFGNPISQAILNPIRTRTTGDLHYCGSSRFFLVNGRTVSPQLAQRKRTLVSNLIIDR